ncbi:hypothetical protein V8G54_031117 [Vigna mungo]|uniref:Uncharacterized protein n=1 Tax=Vigna mungo TaxID=3915 RepID=A0AAQ3RLW2_VIGMU
MQKNLNPDRRAIEHCRCSPSFITTCTQKNQVNQPNMDVVSNRNNVLLPPPLLHLQSKPTKNPESEPSLHYQQKKHLTNQVSTSKRGEGFFPVCERRVTGGDLGRDPWCWWCFGWRLAAAGLAQTTVTGRMGWWRANRNGGRAIGGSGGDTIDDGLWRRSRVVRW